MKKKNIRPRIAAILVLVALLSGAFYLYATTDHLWIRASGVTVTVNGQTHPAPVLRSSRGALLVKLETSGTGFFIVDHNPAIKRADVRQPNEPDFFLFRFFALCKNPNEEGKQLGPISSDFPPNYIETPHSIEFTSPRNERVKIVW